jgi:hypothetical protein
MTFAQVNWVQKKSGHGITVYEAPTEGKFKTVKVHAVLDGTMQKLVRILQSVDQNSDWVYATKRSYLIEKSSDSNLIYYAETALPWPLRNRDQPIHMVIHPITPDSILTVTTIGIPDRIPVTDGLVRIRKFSGTWKVKTLNPTQIQIDYILNVDPNGSVPAWLVNMFVSKGPYETFSSLAEKLMQ